MKTLLLQIQGYFNQTVRILRAWLNIAWDWLVDFFLRVKIRVKLSLIVGASILIVTFIISTISLDIQERELRLQANILGTNITQSLTAVAQDNLLLDNIIAIQDYLNNSVKQKVPAMQDMMVIDRNGKIVAHFKTEHIDEIVSPEEWDALTAFDSTRLVETDEHLRFMRAIFVKSRRGDDTKDILLGSAMVTFSKEVLFAPVQEMKQNIILASFLVSCVAISVVFFFSKRIVNIIIRLSDAARNVGLGDLKIEVRTRAKDELGALTHDFNQMVMQIREKTEMQKFVSKATLQVIADGKEMKLEGTRRVITTLFTDVRNFTSVSEQLWPEEIVETLNQYLDLQTKIIDKNNGSVDKFLGDGLMSIFQGKDMVQNAVTAAVEIQQQISELNRARKERKEVVLEIGIGVATGIAVVGSVGSHNRMDYTAIGDTVNLSSRLCGLAGPSEILVTKEVTQRLNGFVTSTPQGKVQVKGKAQRVEIFKIPYVKP
ncbi:MAG: HAMP domain-containing protein [Ignavibacteriae bacterium]|nr:HAMP domain-containing protein [Ignavibacteriota bacterium]